MTPPDNRARAAHWSPAGLLQGARFTLPLLPGIVVFATAYGAIAAQKGLTLVEATLMSALVYGGASQLVALEVWPGELTPTTVIMLALVAATVNLRLVLMSASLRPWLGTLPAWQVYPSLFFTTDAGWLIAMRYRDNGGSDAAVFLGQGLALWLVWVSSAIPGYLIGALLSEPKRFGLDLVLPVFFVAMLVPLWRGARRGAAWLIAGAVALLCAHFIPGWWFILIGALAGSLAGGFVDHDE
jgi:predicted branched-subunit amino acid permease